MKRLLIISKEQFGYHTDIYKWCEYLQNEYKTIVVCFGGKPKVQLNNVNVCYVPHVGNRAIKGTLYILVSLFHMLFHRGEIIVCNFTGCAIFKKLLPWKKMILDIRTLGVIKDEGLRKQEDEKTKKTADIYDFVTIISEGTREKLGLPKWKSAILPLGADIVSQTNKEFQTLRLLYIGTLQDRDIDKTIKGMAMFINRHPNVDITYDIVGSGYDNEVERFTTLAKELGIEKNVKLHGYVQHDKLKDFYNKCNVGVSFVPITDYYDHQPVTKTYEYVLSGLYTIATNTISNKLIITEENGLLIDDTVESFARGIEYITNNSNSIDGKKIRETLIDTQWEKIVKEIMSSILNDYRNKFNK